VSGASHLRARARRRRYSYLTIFLPQKCHPRPLHPNRAARAARTSRADGANLGGKAIGLQVSDTYADLAVVIHACAPRRKSPASLASRLATRGEGPAKRGANATKLWPPRDGMWDRQTERPTGPGPAYALRAPCPTGAACLPCPALHRMRILSGLEAQTFGGGDRSPPRTRSRTGVRPSPVEKNAHVAYRLEASKLVRSFTSAGAPAWR
jgi:hypothetical protein